MVHNSPYFAGIDLGSSTVKVVIIDGNRRVLGSSIRKSSTDLGNSSSIALEEALEKANVQQNEIEYVISTGYGRDIPSVAGGTKTEIACHSKGCYHYFPEEITVVDIGAQDSKIIKLDAMGHTKGFKMNRKCAAGTGGFLEDMAYKLEVPLETLDSLARSATSEVKIGSYCTVFAATEVLEKIRRGEQIENIARGLFESITKRILEMDVFSGSVILTGGVIAFNGILAELLSAAIKGTVRIAPHPQEMGAFGAALFALEHGQIS